MYTKKWGVKTTTSVIGTNNKKLNLKRLKKKLDLNFDQVLTRLNRWLNLVFAHVLGTDMLIWSPTGSRSGWSGWSIWYRSNFSWSWSWSWSRISTKFEIFDLDPDQNLVCWSWSWSWSGFFKNSWLCWSWSGSIDPVDLVDPDQNIQIKTFVELGAPLSYHVCLCVDILRKYFKSQKISK